MILLITGALMWSRSRWRRQIPSYSRASRHATLLLHSGDFFFSIRSRTLSIDAW